MAEQEKPVTLDRATAFRIADDLADRALDRIELALGQRFDDNAASEELYGQIEDEFAATLEAIAIPKEAWASSRKDQGGGDG